MKQDMVTTRIASVKSYSLPYDVWHDRYQEYYREGLRRYLIQQGARFKVASPRFSRPLCLLRWVRNSGRVHHSLGPLSAAANSLLDSLAWCLGAQLRPRDPIMGQYNFCFENEREIRACIDSHDSGDISSASLLAESDLYFKTNYWTGRDYDSKVVSLYNCNPIVLRHLAVLQAMRGQPAQYDLCLVVRVWGGRDETEGVEHCVRLLEEAARLRGRKYLLAYLVAGDIKAIGDRLRKSGIPSTTKPLPLKELWQVAAQSRVNVIRLGMHHCVPWRMFDLLALGGCPVLDQSPKTVWPVPLVEGKHYWALNLRTSPEQPMALDASYKCIPDLLDALLSDKHRLEQMRGATAEYFDQHLRPERVGQYICETVMGQLGLCP